MKRKKVSSVKRKAIKRHGTQANSFQGSSNEFLLIIGASAMILFSVIYLMR